MENLAFRTAEQQVRNYRAESDTMAEHYKAMNCRDCEAFLKLGIDAFTWVTYADSALRQAIYEGTIKADSAADIELANLCEGWLKPCAQAEAWIAELQRHGYVPDNLEPFRACCREMEALVRFQKQVAQPLPDAMAALRDRALEDNRNGETAEIFSESESDD